LPPGEPFSFGNVHVPIRQHVPEASIAATWVQFPAAGGTVIGRVPAVVGEPLDFSSTVSMVIKLGRTPPLPAGWPKTQQTGSFSPPRFIARVRGLHVLELELSGGFRKSLEIVALEAGELNALMVSDATDQRKRFRSVVRDPRITTESIVDAFETHPFAGSETFARLVHGKASAPFRAQDFGI
jgi:hypothetical protein